MGLGTAIDFMEKIGMDVVFDHERKLTNYALSTLNDIKGLHILGSAKNRNGVISFYIDGIHAHDLAQFLNEDNIAIRVGHHCAQPIMDRFEIPGTVRASFALYNTETEIDIFIEGIDKVKKMFG